MADTYTTSLRLRKPEVGASENTWGGSSGLNGGVMDMVDEAIAGIHSESVASGNVTLSTNFGATDAARQAMVILTGSPGTTRTVTFPDVEKLTWVLNNTGDGSAVTLTAGAGTTVTLKSGYFALVRSDGATNMARIIQTDLLDVAGVRFPSVQVASSDVNCQDDYEEGTFTPTLGDGTNNYTLSLAEGYYTKIGNRVCWEAAMVWSDIGSAGASQLQMGALPFTVANVGTYRASAAVGSFSGLDTTATLNEIKAHSAKNETIVKLERMNDNAAPTALPANGSSATGWLYLSGTYRVT